MSNKNKYIALPGGKECKPVNPYKYGETLHNDFNAYEFEQDNPTYALTEVMPEGETFEGEEQHQIQLASGQWSRQPWKPLIYDGPYRLAIKPLKVIEPVNKCECSKGYEQDECQYHDGNECVRFGVGATIQNKSLADVVENKEETVEDKPTVAGCYGINRGCGFPECSCELPKSKFESSPILKQNIVKKWLQDMPKDETAKIIGVDVEGIVGFVLEWVANHMPALKHHSLIKDMKSDIIKEYNKLNK